MDKLFDVVVAGHLCVDIYPDLSHFPSGLFFKSLLPGKLLHVGDATISAGGIVSNTGQSLHRLGVNVRLMGKIGDDAFGKIIYEKIHQQDPLLTDGLIYSRKEGSSYTIILNSPGVDRIFLHFPGMNDIFNFTDINFHFVSQAKLFHFGYPPLMQKMYEDCGENLLKILKETKQHNVVTSLDMALPDPYSPAGKVNWLEIIKKLLPFVDIFVPSFEEIAFMVYQSGYIEMMEKATDGNILPLVTPHILDEISNILFKLGAKIIMIKLGERGVFVRTQSEKVLDEITRILPININNWSSREIWAPCFKVNLAGTTGAGDATVAGFLASLIKGLDIESSIQMAVAVGACCVEMLDAISGIQPWDTICKRIADGWERYQMHIYGSEWSYNKYYQHWEKQS